jgi:hypothetical protein
MKNKTTFELMERLKAIKIEKQNLENESALIMQELWERVDDFNIKEKPKTLVKVGDK